MNGFALRPYQSQAISDTQAALRKNKNVILQLATGGGKTVITAHMIHRAMQKSKSSWFLVHRKELLEQTSETLLASGVQHGIIQAGHKPRFGRVQLASVQTLVRRLGKYPKPDFIIVDEAHHASANTYREILAHCPDSYVIGLTATPHRTDGQGLGDLFGDIVSGPSVSDLISQGYLSDYRVFAPNTVDTRGVHTRGGEWVRGELEVVVDTPKIVGDAVSHYLKMVAPRTCLVYCVSRKHARRMTEAYQAAGVDARYCAGDTPKEERQAIISGLRVGSPPVVVSVDLFGEGLDAPGLAAVQLLRPTQSLTLHLQQCGRALRPEASKKYAIILDHVGNCMRHGLPDDEREWTLEGSKKRPKNEEMAMALRTCKDCFAVYRATLLSCPSCGKPAEATRRSGPQEIEGELVELEKAQVRRHQRLQERNAKTLEDWVAIAKERGYAGGAAWAGLRWSLRGGGDRGQCIRDAQRIWREIA